MNRKIFLPTKLTQNWSNHVILGQNYQQKNTIILAANSKSLGLWQGNIFIGKSWKLQFEIPAKSISLCDPKKAIIGCFRASFDMEKRHIGIVNCRLSSCDRGQNTFSLLDLNTLQYRTFPVEIPALAYRSFYSWSESLCDTSIGWVTCARITHGRRYPAQLHIFKIDPCQQTLIPLCSAHIGSSFSISQNAVFVSYPQNSKISMWDLTDPESGWIQYSGHDSTVMELFSHDAQLFGVKINSNLCQISEIKFNKTTLSYEQKKLQITQELSLNHGVKGRVILDEKRVITLSNIYPIVTVIYRKPPSLKELSTVVLQEVFGQQERVYKGKSVKDSKKAWDGGMTEEEMRKMINYKGNLNVMAN